ncbi:SGNH/GDSL hydrolase family protein [Pseudarcicella hirudinis]|nr:SGNH/GDSL hydrolase family protein [Pseudarcicella hirudinis]
MKKLLIICFLLSARFGFAQHAFENEIQTFEKQDADVKPAKGTTLFVGSSSFRLWVTFTNDMKGFQAINRGFGGSQMSDVLYFFDRVVKPYQPKWIFLYEGDNDINSGENPEAIYAEFQEFVSKVKRELPGTRIAFVGLRPSLARLQNMDKQKQLNSLVKSYCSQTEGMYFIDTFSPFFDEKNELLKDIFVADNLHLNTKGYQIWTNTITHFMAEKGVK